MTGRFIAVVGPSGVGKDSVMAGLMERRPDLLLAKRVITRPYDPGAEDHQPASVEDFQIMVQQGAFVLHWGAHGLFYGIPTQVLDLLASGRDVLANLSRGALVEASQKFPQFHVLAITADAATLAARLADRGRETPDDIAARLARAAEIPAGLPVTMIHNNGALSDAVDAAEAALFAPVE
ncbi:MAG: phosphonate metabolism protein/1,5-bisphosphokinase (PRPP-forming) PhnN [Mangrovicoccus sp.]